ncbi:hypothetical protein BDZ45DRAFT_810335 [Acephala macrosclerotiorum]|nr:hypothetical protein BDZ45DRAFT_810335 [Acephala macrosclerotiorum]
MHCASSYEVRRHPTAFSKRIRAVYLQSQRDEDIKVICEHSSELQVAKNTLPDLLEVDHAACECALRYYTELEADSFCGTFFYMNFSKDTLRFEDDEAMNRLLGPKWHYARYHQQAPNSTQGKQPELLVSAAKDNFLEGLGQRIIDIKYNENWGRTNYLPKRKLYVSNKAGILSLRPFKDAHLWRNAYLEGVGLCTWVFIAGLVAYGTTSLSSATSLDPILPIGIAAIVQFLITFFIFSLGPVTSAHLTPLITFATFLAKLTSLPRMILYITFQCIGTVVGAYVLRSALGGNLETLVFSPGCYIDPTLIPSTQAFALETTGALFVLFLAFGLGLDPRNQGSFGPTLGPFLVRFSSAVALLQEAL